MALLVVLPAPAASNRSQVRAALKTGILDCPIRKNADGTSLAEQYEHLTKQTCVLTTDGRLFAAADIILASESHLKGTARRVNLAAVAA